MIVTDKKFALEKKLKKKLDLMINRCSGNKKKDNLLLIEGAEGDGKTNMSVGLGYYIHSETGRPFGNKNIFFKLDEMLKFAQSTKDQIIIWDEPALDGLSNEWWKTTQRNLVKLLMMARKKRHFFIFNISKFTKFNEYLIERAIGMVRVYARKQVQLGRFVYYRKEALMALFYKYRSSRKKLYKKYVTFRGSFPYVLPLLIDEAVYEKEKDEAIMSIGKTDAPTSTTRYKAENIELKYKIANNIQAIAKTFKIKQKDLLKVTKIPRATFKYWHNRGGVVKKDQVQPTTINNNGISVVANTPTKKDKVIGGKEYDKADIDDAIGDLCRSSSAKPNSSVVL